MAHTVHGNTRGLATAAIKGLERIYRRKIPAGRLITEELQLYLTKISRELKRQLALLVDRRGKITHVIVGDDRQIVIPRITDRKIAGRRLAGLRCIHTHLKKEPLSQDDINDLIILRLDAMATIDVLEDGSPGKISLAHISPASETGYLKEGPARLPDIQEYFEGLISGIEEDLDRQVKSLSVRSGETAMLIHVSNLSQREMDASLDELSELARTAGIAVVDRIRQKLLKTDPKYLMGKGKLQEFMIAALSHGISMVIFDTELTPAQLKAITDFTDIDVMDRTQLILSIFERRATSRDGKIRVALAQMRYLLPRLSAKESALSRIRGGIGLRGPGETTAETQRRHLQGRIDRLEKELEYLKEKREQKRKLRAKSETKTVSIIGYTNAGKSTLLNRLTRSSQFVEDLLFATLDPASRRLYLPSGETVVISDTVGLIRDMPESIIGAFRATLEELAESDILIHLVDASNPEFEEHMKTAENILVEMDLHLIPRITALNKTELLEPDTVAALAARLCALPISAHTGKGLDKLLERISERLSASHRNER